MNQYDVKGVMVKSVFCLHGEQILSFNSSSGFLNVKNRLQGQIQDFWKGVQMCKEEVFALLI